MKILTGVVLLALVLVFSGCATMKSSVSSKSLQDEVDRLEQENEMLAMQRDAYKVSIERLSQETKTKLEDLQNSLAQEKQKTMELETKIATLSSELQSFKGIDTTKAKPAIVTDDFTKKVQLALYTAGFDPGKIDGKMGTQTIQAIKNFQEANGLKVDGIVGKETWDILQKYLEMK
ncbi:MAG: peptidoglycan-binding protein [Candidatus Ratteibacteria bacterium]|nr:peptidoglycan-binding protein [Candidatus Ratteibacteria bacterium]